MAFKRIQTFFALLCFFAASVPSLLAAKDVYQTPKAFIEDSFDNKHYNQKTLKVTDVIDAKIKNIMGHHYDLKDVSYWSDGNKTAWILEAIGKYKPITTGFVVNDKNELERIKVLIYRESHGWEVKHDFFTRQFKNVGLRGEKRLDKRIDGISGATLSVNALKKLSALALTLHKEVKE